MATNTSIKVVFKAYDQTQELIFPKEYQLHDFMNYIRNICNTAIILDMQPTTKQVTI